MSECKQSGSVSKYGKQLAYLKENGFTFNCELRAYTKEVRHANEKIILGLIVVRDFGNMFINPIFRASGQVYLSLPTLDHIANLIDKYDRALTRIELGY